MSNRASLRRTKFTNDDDSVDWGWRLCDDYFRSYVDYCEEYEVPEDPLQLLTKACAEASEQERALFEDLLAGETGLLINGSWHEFEEIGPALRMGLKKED